MAYGTVQDTMQAMSQQKSRQAQMGRAPIIPQRMSSVSPADIEQRRMDAQNAKMGMAVPKQAVGTQAPAVQSPTQSAQPQATADQQAQIASAMQSAQPRKPMPVQAQGNAYGRQNNPMATPGEQQGYQNQWQRNRMTQAPASPQARQEAFQRQLTAANTMAR